jgi:UDP-N-acetylmuramoylalanine--D-glutamate ligase
MAKDSGLNVRIGGNIGIPVLELLLEPDANTVDVYVLELSSFQLETTKSLRARVASVLNLSADHMDRYDSMDAYIQAKMTVYQGSHMQVVNAQCVKDYPALFAEFIQRGNAVVFDSALDNSVNYTGTGIAKFGLLREDSELFLAKSGIKLIPISDLKIQGMHNVENSLSALALGHALGLPLPRMLKTLKEFRGLPHRCEFVCEYNAIKWYNDSKGTNVGATIAAINGFGTMDSGKIILLAGGVGKGADFSALLNPVAKYVSNVILFGESKNELAEILSSVVCCHKVHDLAAAVTKAGLIAQKRDIVLLSPACASFDMFDSFVHRGNEFIRLVNTLICAN